MADVVIDNAVDGNTFYPRAYQSGPVFTSRDVGYMFFCNSSRDLAYRKTTDGGTSWGSATVLGARTISDWCIWFDKWTPGNTGTVIHIAYADVPDTVSVDMYYRAFDTAGDSIGSEVTLQQFVVTGAALFGNIHSTTGDAGSVGITRAQGGNIYVTLTAHIEDAAGDTEIGALYRSTDGGSSFASRTSPFEGVGGDSLLLFPADTTDSQDIGAAYIDGSANAISVKVYDDSANTWTETAITSLTEAQATVNMAAAVRHSDQHVILVFFNGLDSATTDLRCYDLTLTSTTVTVTAKTNVLTDTAEAQCCALFIDQTNDDIYVAYLFGTTWDTAVRAYYKKSTDGGTSWSSAVQVTEAAEATVKRVYSGVSTPGVASGRFYVAWLSDTVDDLLGSAVNSVVIAASQSVVPSVLALTTSFFAPNIPSATVCAPSTASLITSLQTPVALQEYRFTPSTLALGTSLFAPTASLGPLTVTPGVLALTTTPNAPAVRIASVVTPATVALLTTLNAPVTALGPLTVTPGTLSLGTTAFAPSLVFGTIVRPDILSLVLQGFAPALVEVLTPGTLALTATGSAPAVLQEHRFTPGVLALVTTTFAPTANLLVVIEYGITEVRGLLAVTDVRVTYAHNLNPQHAVRTGRLGL